MPTKENEVRSARQGDHVVLSYVGRRQNGTVFAETGSGPPLQVKLGEGQLHRRLEEAVEGMAPGAIRTIRLDPESAYGPHDAELVYRVPLDRLPEGLDPDVGERVELLAPPRGVRHATVTGRTESEVVLDANHPLAGQAITYELRLLEIR
jgi:FKBP-type peptidyl-prolyl cis-trans isomerase 2